MVDWLEIGERIRNFREARGLQRLEVATKIGVRIKHIEKIENGSSGCSINTLIKLAETYDVSLDELILNKRPRDFRVAETRRLAQEILKLTDEKTENH